MLIIQINCNYILDEHELEHNDMVSLFITLCECYCMEDQIEKAIKTVNHAYEYLKDTKFEEEIKLAEAKIAWNMNNIKNALNILDSIKPDQDTFIKVNKLYLNTYLYIILVIMYNKLL